MAEVMTKDFKGWIPIKEKIHNEAKFPTFNKREIWWCSTGINVGYEQDGKNILCERPVLIVRKFNKRLFWGLPITSKIKEHPYYHSIFYKGPSDNESKERRIILSQLRVYDSSRLSRHIVKLAEPQFDDIRNMLKSIIDEK